MIHVYREERAIQEILLDSSCPFPLSAFRAVAWPYFEVLNATPFSRRSFVVLEGDNPIACALIASPDQLLSFLGLPVRIEILDSFKGSENLPELLGVISRELMPADGAAVQGEIEIPLLQEKTNPLIETLLLDSVAHQGFVEVHAPLSVGDPIENSFSGPHRRSFRKASELLGAPEVWFGNVDQDIFDEFRSLHRDSAGRVTRPTQSWQEMFKAIQQRTASLVTVHHADKLIGATFCWISPSTSYYGTGAYDRTRFADFPISHLTMAHSMNVARDNGCSTFIVGEAYAPGGTPKEKGIAQFKRGFSKSRRHFHRVSVARSSGASN